MPSVEEFAGLVGVENGDGGGVEELEVGDFDPRGDYGEVVDAVTKAAGRGKVSCFRVEGEGSGRRTEVRYYVIGLNGNEGRLVGVRALSVES